MSLGNRVNEEIQLLTKKLADLQREDGSWRFCFENGTSTDAYMIVVLRTLELPYEALIRSLHDRIAERQQDNGAWKVYPDEDEGNLAATVDAYYAMLYSGYSRHSDEAMRKAARFIAAKGGIKRAESVLTKVFLAATGSYPWPPSLIIPLEVLLLPASSPLNMFDFSGYARVHMIPIMIMASRRFVERNDATPDLSDLKDTGRMTDPPGQSLSGDLGPSRGFQQLLDEMQEGIKQLASLPGQLHQRALKRAEQYMLDRIEPDGTLYSYATSTLLMIMAFLSLGYPKRHPILLAAIDGLVGMLWNIGGHAHLQNSPSDIWDTALLSDALQQAGVSPESAVLRQSSAYLLGKQHSRQGDWALRMPDTVAGGWGFSESNTINPDVDDTTAALRALRHTARRHPSRRDAWNRGLNWVLAMQNKDGGWPAFEKGVTKELLALFPIDGAPSASIDPSTADLTGRTLEFLGNTACLGRNHAFIRRGVEWLEKHQEEDGSWFGRWGVCYIYGTWGALTGMRAVGEEAEHPVVSKAVRWLLSIQNPDGGWGESCSSDRVKRYVPLGASTPSQTAWALDALIAVYERPVPAIEKGIQLLAALLHKDDWTTRYPTGAGLPGFFYSHYHSYRYIWPLLTLSHYKQKYGKLGL
ncbi:squalene--hopene cyclase [Paenibacillus puerhi]|uniref:squalene--hopene cyclase n=1 Tax=Paenibacillus puerhi TaxID=2692622 RepID=UPI001358E601|nr:squalene--hopene cyclase [Paenibacillus puerhi]